MKKPSKLPLYLGVASTALAGCQSAEQKPNIVFFLADDIGTEAFGCYGGAEYETPNVDRLAAEGLMYTNGNAQPLSSPSRVQAMTGLYNDRNYVAFGYMNPDETTFAQCVREAGYSTAMVGKWQLGCDRRLPHELGFDETFLSQVKLYRESRGPEKTDRYANSMWDNNGKHYEYAQYGPDAMQEYAFDYIDRQVAGKQPFLLYYTEPLVHTPHVTTPDSEDWDILYESRFTAAQDTSRFRDMVKYMDKQVGELVRHLKEKGVWDNTIFIFAADNGTSTRIVSRQKDGSTIRGGKGEPNWRGTHVPYIITWGNRIEPRRIDHIVDFTDIMPTMIEAAGGRIPEGLDGVSLYPELLGGTVEKELALIHFNPLWPTAPSPKASRYAMNDEYAYFWDGRIYRYKEDPTFTNPTYYDSASEEVRSAVAALKERVDEYDNFYPDCPGAPRRGDYGTFYDWAPPQNPF